MVLHCEILTEITTPLRGGYSEVLVSKLVGVRIATTRL